MIREAHNRQGSGAQMRRRVRQQCSRRRRDSAKMLGLCVARSQGLCRTARTNTAPEQTAPRTDNTAENRRARFTNGAAESLDLPKPLLERRHRKRCAAEADQAREPTAAEDAELGRASRSDHRTDAQTSRADEAATVRHNRQGSGAQTAPSCERANVDADADQRKSARPLRRPQPRVMPLCRVTTEP